MLTLPLILSSQTSVELNNSNMKDRQRTFVLLCSLLLLLPVHQAAAGVGDHDPQVSEDTTPELL